MLIARLQRACNQSTCTGHGAVFALWPRTP
jgi:hypothetical protein